MDEHPTMMAGGAVTELEPGIPFLQAKYYLMVTSDPLGWTCGNKYAGIRGSPRAFTVIVAQLVTLRCEPA